MSAVILTRDEQLEFKAFMLTVDDDPTFGLHAYDTLIKTVWDLHAPADSVSRKRKHKRDQPQDPNCWQDALLALARRVVNRVGVRKGQGVIQAVRAAIDANLNATTAATHTTSLMRKPRVRRLQMFSRDDSEPTYKRARLELKASRTPSSVVPVFKLFALNGCISLPTALCLCSLSHGIRHAVMTSPAAWTDITGLTSQGVDALAFLLGLSNNGLLSVNMDFASSDDAATALDHLRPHVLRIQDLALRSSVDLGDAQDNFSRFFRIRAYKLSVLVLRLPGLREVLHPLFLSRTQQAVLECTASLLPRDAWFPTVTTLRLTSPDQFTDELKAGGMDYPAHLLAVFPALERLTTAHWSPGQVREQATRTLMHFELKPSDLPPDDLRDAIDDLNGQYIPHITWHGQHAEYITLALNHLGTSVTGVDYVLRHDKLLLHLTAGSEHHRLIVDADPVAARRVIVDLHMHSALRKLGFSLFLEPHQIHTIHKSIPRTLTTIEFLVDNRARSGTAVNFLTLKPRHKWVVPPCLETLRFIGKAALAPELRDEDDEDEHEILKVLPTVSAGAIVQFINEQVGTLSRNLTVEIVAAELEEKLGHKDVHELCTLVKAFVLNGERVDPSRAA